MLCLQLRPRLAMPSRTSLPVNCVMLAFSEVPMASLLDTDQPTEVLALPPRVIGSAAADSLPRPPLTNAPSPNPMPAFGPTEALKQVDRSTDTILIVLRLGMAWASGCCAVPASPGGAASAQKSLVP